jgi:hypothetical protein
MDSGSTNGNNIVQWTDRTLTTSITQDLVHNTPTVQISSITDASNVNSSFSGDWKVLLFTYFLGLFYETNFTISDFEKNLFREIIYY